MMGGKHPYYVYPAVSGRPVKGVFDYSDARQRASGMGPIPEGVYWIRPDQLSDNWLKYKLMSSFAAAWGEYRITIHPFPTTQTFGRGGFFIHGGTEPGSAGCIDLTMHIDRFASDLVREVGDVAACQIHLTVAYPRMGDFPERRARSRLA